MYVAGNFANFQIEFLSSFVLILDSIELITLIWYLMLITKCTCHNTFFTACGTTQVFLPTPVSVRPCIVGCIVTVCDQESSATNE